MAVLSKLCALEDVWQTASNCSLPPIASEISFEAKLIDVAKPNLDDGFVAKDHSMDGNNNLDLKIAAFIYECVCAVVQTLEQLEEKTLSSNFLIINSNAIVCKHVEEISIILGRLLEIYQHLMPKMANALVNHFNKMVLYLENLEKATSNDAITLSIDNICGVLNGILDIRRDILIAVNKAKKNFGVSIVNHIDKVVKHLGCLLNTREELLQCDPSKVIEIASARVNPDQAAGAIFDCVSQIAGSLDKLVALRGLD